MSIRRKSNDKERERKKKAKELVDHLRRTLAVSSRPSNEKFTTTYDNCTFTFKKKYYFEKISRTLVTLTSRKLKGDQFVERNLTFYRSNSECGMWRLCVVKPGESAYFQKGLHYTASSFIILELQIFLNSILEDLPSGDGEDFDGLLAKDCHELYKTIDDTINWKYRENGMGYLGFPHSAGTPHWTADQSTIELVAPYKFTSLYNNAKPVLANINTNDIHSDFTSQESLEDKKYRWPNKILSEKPELEVRPYYSISFGDTKIDITGNIYKAQIYDANPISAPPVENGIKNPVTLYYLIYDCEIETPEELQIYGEKATESDPNPNYAFDNKIKVKNFIIPIYAIPTDPNFIPMDTAPHIMSLRRKGDPAGYSLYDKEFAEHNKRPGEDVESYFEREEKEILTKLEDLTSYGLYKFYSSFTHKQTKPTREDPVKETLEFGKILEYIHRCKGKILDYAPSCTTFYKFFGSFYNNIPTFADLKQKTNLMMRVANKFKSNISARRGGKLLSKRRKTKRRHYKK
jgi:hypothetical protein